MASTWRNSNMMYDADAQHEMQSSLKFQDQTVRVAFDIDLLTLN